MCRGTTRLEVQALRLLGAGGWLLDLSLRAPRPRPLEAVCTQNNWATGQDMHCRLSDSLLALTRVVAELGHLEVVVGVKVPGQEDKGWTGARGEQGGQ